MSLEPTANPSTLLIVGLGPGSPALLTQETRQALDSAPRVILRTRHHPTVAALSKQSAAWQDCDDLYQQELGFDAVYAESRSASSPARLRNPRSSRYPDTPW